MGTNARLDTTDRRRLVGLLGEERVAALEARGIEIAVELRGEGDADELVAVFEEVEAVSPEKRCDAAAQRLMAAGQLGAGIVHEVRNMVTSIRGFAQVGSRKLALGEDVAPLLALIENESGRCEQTLSGFLGFAGAERTLSWSSVNDIVDRAIGLVRHRLSLDGVRVEATLAPDLPDVRVCAGEITQVLVNLALNAQQAMQGPGLVRFETGRGERGGARIDVVDDGPGVPAAARARIFEPFFTTRGDRGGTGLGLAVSARIAEQHGGSLSLVDTTSGARFRVDLPEDGG